MGRGLISGILWGTISAAIILITLSQLTGKVYLLVTPPEAVTDSAPEAVPSEELIPEPAPSAPVEAAPPATEPSRQSVELESDDAETDAAPAAETAPAEQPQTGAAMPLPTEPEVGASPEIAEVATDAPTAPVVSELVAPQAPAIEAAPEVSVVAPEPILTAPTEVMPEAPVMPTPEVDGQPDAGQAPVIIEEPAQPEVVVAESPVVPEPTPTEEAIVADEPADAPDAGMVAPEAPAVAEEAPEQSEMPVVSQPEDTVVTAADPAVVDAPVAEETPVAETAAPEAKPSFDIAAGNALAENALAFVVPRNRPVVGVVLLDDPDMMMGMGAIARLPFPVTFAIDPRQRGARGKMDEYLKAGHEVAALTDLPVAEGAAAVQASLIKDIKALPRAMAIVDNRDAAFQSNSTISAAVVEVLAHTGHGLLTYSRGQNAGVMAAQREDVPVGLVFRVFDGDGQNVGAIKRFIDQAAFRAQQQEGVIMVGHLRPDTLRALVEWGLENRGSAVTLAPLSVVLKR